MKINEFFNPENTEHLKAYRHLQDTGFWPEGFTGFWKVVKKGWMKVFHLIHVERRNEMRWLFHVDVKQFLTEKEDYDSIKKSMENIAGVLEKEPCFKRFKTLPRFRKIKDDDEGDFLVISNHLLDKMYDYADDNRIWLG